MALTEKDILSSNGPLEKELRQRTWNWRNWFIGLILIMLVILFSLINNRFFSLQNFENIVRQVSVVAIVAFGMTFVITAAQIDLSVGAVVAMVGVVAALGIQAGLGWPLSSLIGLVIGTLIGFVNGLIVTKARIPSFLVTLGMMSIVRGAALTITGSEGVPLYSKTFVFFWGSGDFLHIPVCFLWLVLILGVSVILYRYTIFGNHVKATGGNVVAAKFSGINTNSVIIKSFVLIGFLTAIAGLIMASRVVSGRPDIGSDLELDAIAAVILGGTSLFGGRGSIVSSLVGALILTVITNGLIILGVAYSVQQIIKGGIIIAAVSLSSKT